MLSSVNHVEARDRKSLWAGVARNFSIMLPERNSLGTSSSLGGSEGDCDV
jgi:hypothetical protein